MTILDRSIRYHSYLDYRYFLTAVAIVVVLLECQIVHHVYEELAVPKVDGTLHVLMLSVLPVHPGQ